MVVLGPEGGSLIEGDPVLEESEGCGNRGGGGRGDIGRRDLVEGFSGLDEDTDESRNLEEVGFLGER